MYRITLDAWHVGSLELHFQNCAFCMKSALVVFVCDLTISLDYLTMSCSGDLQGNGADCDCACRCDLVGSWLVP